MAQVLSSLLEGREPPLTLRQENHYLYFGHLFPLYARAFFPVVRRFFCGFPTEQVLYYRNLGLYYRLASTTLPLYAKPRAKVKGGCLSCDSKFLINSVQTRCIVKGEAQKSPLFWRFSGGF